MIILKLTEEQAQLVGKACEFYTRIKMGQFHEIVWNTLDMKLPSEMFCKRRDEAERLLYAAREYIYPELHGRGHSYGMGKFEDADKVFDVYQVIRYTTGDPRPPFSNYELPECQKA